MKRRHWLRRTAAGVMGVGAWIHAAAGNGYRPPGDWPAEWPADWPTGWSNEWPAELRAQVQAWTAGRPIRDRGLTLELPEIVDNGNDVPIRVTAEAPTPTGVHVQRMAVWAPRNPHPLVMDVELSRLVPRAELHTRMRLASTQRVLALARWSDGTVCGAQQSVLVALAACIEG